MSPPLAIKKRRTSLCSLCAAQCKAPTIMMLRNSTALDLEIVCDNVVWVSLLILNDPLIEAMQSILQEIQLLISGGDQSWHLPNGSMFTNRLISYLTCCPETVAKANLI